jgi:hypothetical protein
MTMIPNRANNSSCFSSLPRFSFSLAFSVVLLLCASMAAAQSGRRNPTGSPSVAAPTPTPDAKEKTSEAAKDVKRQELILTTNRGDAFAGIPLYYYDTVLRSCGGRLDDSRGVKVTVVSKHTARAEAINTAKASKEAYVVWLELKTDSMRNSTPGYNLGDIMIDYTVYEPTTAKVKAHGTSYQGSARAGGVAVGLPGSGGTNSAVIERRLQEAAIDAAERILKALHLASSSDLPPH